MGELALVSDGRALIRCAPAETLDLSDCARGTDAIILSAARELSEYFDKRLAAFTTPIRMTGSEFDARVWEITRQIAYGETRAYGELALELGAKNLSRAVGGSLGRNRLMIFVPCHRVLGADGRLRGFAGGLDMKAKLLSLEGVVFRY